MNQIKKILVILCGINFANALSAVLRNKNNRLILKKLFDYEILLKKDDLETTKLAVINTSYCYASPKYGFKDSTLNKLKLFGDFTNYVLSLKNVSIIGDSNFLLLKEKSLIYFSNFFYHDNTQINDDALVSQFGSFYLLRVKKETIDIEQGIYFLGYNSFNYYHLLYEIIARFEYINNLNLDINIPLLIDFACKDIVQYQELFRYFNKDKRTIIYIDKNKLYNIISLIYITTPNFIPADFKDLGKIKADNVLFSSSSINYLNNSLLPILKKNDKYPSKLYLSRKISSSRRGFNESEIENYLNSQGFFSFNANSYSICEQLSFFYNAVIIVGGAGAAFSNIFVCREHCKIILFSNYQFDLSTFSTIAAIKNLDFTHLYDRELILDKNSSLHDDFKIEIDDLKQYL